MRLIKKRTYIFELMEHFSHVLMQHFDSLNLMQFGTKAVCCIPAFNGCLYITFDEGSGPVDILSGF